MTDRVEQFRSRRILRFAVLGSLLVHAIGIVLWGFATQRFPSLRAFPRASPTPDIVVSISHAVTIEKRARPAPRKRPVAPRPAPAARAVVPEQPRALVQAVPQHPTLEVPRALHELSKEQPKAEVNPPRTLRATPSPRPEPTIPKSEQFQVERARPAQVQQRTGHGQGRLLSQEQLAHIGADLQKTVAQLKREDDPLAVQSSATPSAPKRYRVQMLGADSDLKHGQGIYYPIKSWTQGGYDYYYCAYQFVYADGMTETGGVPWPVRFSPDRDPFLHPEIGRRGEAPLVGPLPGWTLPPGEKIGKALLLAVPGVQDLQHG